MWAGVAMSPLLRHRPDRLRRPLRQARAGAASTCSRSSAWAFFAKDVWVSLQMARRRELRPREFGCARTCSGKKVRGVFAADDPLPALGVPAYRARRSPDADRAARPAELHGALRPRARLGARPARPRRHAADLAASPHGDVPEPEGYRREELFLPRLVAARPPLAALTRSGCAEGARVRAERRRACCAGSERSTRTSAHVQWLAIPRYDVHWLRRLAGRRSCSPPTTCSRGARGTLRAWGEVLAPGGARDRPVGARGRAAGGDRRPARAARAHPASGLRERRRATAAERPRRSSSSA